MSARAPRTQAEIEAAYGRLIESAYKGVRVQIDPLRCSACEDWLPRGHLYGCCRKWARSKRTSPDKFIRWNTPACEYYRVKRVHI